MEIGRTAVGSRVHVAVPGVWETLCGVRLHSVVEGGEATCLRCLHSLRMLKSEWEARGRLTLYGAARDGD